MNIEGYFNRHAYDKHTKDPNGTLLKFVEALDRLGVQCNPNWLNATICARFKQYLHNQPAAVLWGIKLSQQRYNELLTDFLFCEMGLFDQQTGFFVDDKGLYADSSIVIDKEFEEDKAPSKLSQYMLDNFQRPMAIYKHRPVKRILVALQYVSDAPVIQHYHLRGKEKYLNRGFLRYIREYGPDVEYLVRPHPRFYKEWLKHEDKYLEVFGERWKKQVGGSIDDILREVDAVITINSTVALETISYGLPVAVFGENVYTGSNAVLDCSKDPSRLKELTSWEPDYRHVVNLLCSIIEHQIHWGAQPEEIMENKYIKRWIRRITSAGHIRQEVLSEKIK